MPSTYLTTHEAADYLRVSPRTLEGYRVAGFGPAFIKLRNKVLYRKEDLDAWCEQRLHNSTSAYGNAA
jgi:hypothetical protein